MGLLLERFTGEEIRIQFDQRMSAEELDELLRNGITINISEIRLRCARPKVKLWIDAPKGAVIWRAELLEHY